MLLNLLALGIASISAFVMGASAVVLRAERRSERLRNRILRYVNEV